MPFISKQQLINLYEKHQPSDESAFMVCSACSQHWPCDVATFAIEIGVQRRQCEDCGKTFLVRDTRQRFCNDNCASRARYRRKSERRRDRLTRTVKEAAYV